MENKELKIKLGNFKKKNITFVRLFWEDQQKCLQSSQNNPTCHPMNPDTDIYISDTQFI